MPECELLAPASRGCSAVVGGLACEKMKIPCMVSVIFGKVWIRSFVAAGECVLDPSASCSEGRASFGTSSTHKLCKLHDQHDIVHTARPTG